MPDKRQQIERQLSLMVIEGDTENGKRVLRAYADTILRLVDEIREETRSDELYIQCLEAVCDAGQLRRAQDKFDRKPPEER